MILRNEIPKLNIDEVSSSSKKKLSSSILFQAENIIPFSDSSPRRPNKSFIKNFPISSSESSSLTFKKNKNVDSLIKSPKTRSFDKYLYFKLYEFLKLNQSII